MFNVFKTEKPISFYYQECKRVLETNYDEYGEQSSHYVYQAAVPDIKEEHTATVEKNNLISPDFKAFFISHLLKEMKKANKSMDVRDCVNFFDLYIIQAVNKNENKVVFDHVKELENDKNYLSSYIGKDILKNVFTLAQNDFKTNPKNSKAIKLIEVTIGIQVPVEITQEEVDAAESAGATVDYYRKNTISSSKIQLLPNEAKKILETIDKNGKNKLFHSDPDVDAAIKKTLKSAIQTAQKSDSYTSNSQEVVNNKNIEEELTTYFAADGDFTKKIIETTKVSITTSIYNNDEYKNTYDNGPTIQTQISEADFKDKRFLNILIGKLHDKNPEKNIAECSKLANKIISNEPIMVESDNHIMNQNFTIDDLSKILDAALDDFEHGKFPTPQVEININIEYPVLGLSADHNEETYYPTIKLEPITFETSNIEI